MLLSSSRNGRTNTFKISVFAGTRKKLLQREDRLTGWATSPPSHSAGSRLTAPSVRALSYMAPRPCILARSPRSHGCSQASSTQPELAPPTSPHTAPPPPNGPFQHGEHPCQLTQHQRPVGSVCPAHPQAHRHLPHWSSPAGSLCPPAVWSPRGNNFPAGRPSPFFTSYTAVETARSHFEARAAHQERPSVFC